MEHRDPNSAITTEHVQTDRGTGARTIRSIRFVGSGVRIEDLMHFRDEVVAGMHRSREDPLHTPRYKAVGWEMPDGRVIQLYPDVKIVDKVSNYNPVDCFAVRLQTVSRPDGTRDFAPAEHVLPWTHVYKKVNSPWNPPWYIWPLRPILFWTFLVTMSVLFPWWMLGVFCGLSYGVVGWEMWAGRLIPVVEGFWGYLFSFIAAPVLVLLLLAIASFRFLPIL